MYVARDTARPVRASVKYAKSAVVVFAIVTIVAATLTQLLSGSRKAADMSEHGIWEELAPPCDHEVAVRLNTCTICPKCESFTPHTSDLASCYREIVEEIISVQDFGSTNEGYMGALDRAARYIEVAKAK